MQELKVAVHGLLFVLRRLAFAVRLICVGKRWGGLVADLGGELAPHSVVRVPPDEVVRCPAAQTPCLDDNNGGGISSLDRSFVQEFGC